MYTIIGFKPDGSDMWDRFETATELLAFLKENDLMENEDLQIYDHPIDDYLLSVQDVIAAAEDE